jgi:hypothetical protein
MGGIAARPARAFARTGLSLGMILLAAVLSACSHQRADGDGATALNAYPANYKADILAAMHAYLDNPTGIRDAAIGEPTLKSKGGTTRYVVCVKFNGKKNRSNEYAGTKEVAAEFMVGRFDQFIDNIKDLCAGTTYTPFPELQNLPP